MTTGIARPPETPSLAHAASASDYTARVGAIVAQIAEATDQQSVLSLLRASVDALGAESAAFVSFVRDNTDVSACRFMLACEPGWCQRYLDAGCIAHDPWLAYAAHHSEPIVASTLQIADSEGRRVIALAQQSGFASAALVPAHSGAGHSRISLLCLGSYVLTPSSAIDQDRLVELERRHERRQHGRQVFFRSGAVSGGEDLR